MGSRCVCHCQACLQQRAQMPIEEQVQDKLLCYLVIWTLVMGPTGRVIYSFSEGHACALNLAVVQQAQDR